MEGVMPKQWFTNKGQVVQCCAAVVAALLAVFAKVSVTFASIANVFPFPPASLFIGIATGVVISLAIQWWRLKANANPLQLEKTKFVCDDREQTTYKRKLYITLLNSSDNAIVIGPRTEWIEGSLHVNTVAEHLWQVEGRRGYRNNDWEKEATQAVVPPGKRARTWIGLPVDAKQSEVEIYTSKRKAGILAIPVAPVSTLKVPL